ncbi:RCC1 domain-containing protein, alpha-tubulin suppressor [Desulfocurvibacter africanus PCS]|uniref:RCC1 domain-containing protein, alpha-tubulin suppressor n=1 Tax=Desulfocurvibacter africanus PCS TaxID=1262666 RepID=M5PRF9_DESAF|nr:PKD domain-containing protein [Desulfocurvibacter africanus]EMG36719.1 RCC1 domain-containing protein, alpha-tubulin suppressor [Desulfocurvibacter africanus PCS]
MITRSCILPRTLPAAPTLLLTMFLLLSVLSLPKAQPVQAAMRLAGGENHTLALRADGTVWAWGDNSDGQLGNSLVVGNSAVPVQVMQDTDGDGDGDIPLSGIEAFGVGADHCLALGTDGRVWAWGDNSNGQLGNGDATYINSYVPVRVMKDTNGDGDGDIPLSGIRSIAAFGLNSLALGTDGTVWAWGNNIAGQLGNGDATHTNSFVPVQVVTNPGGPALVNIQAVAAGFFHSLALGTDGTVWAWGDNDHGQLGNGTITPKDVAVQVSGTGPGAGLVPGTIKAIAAGTFHSLALGTDDTVWAWGNNLVGQLGNGSTTDSDVPVQIVTNPGVSALDNIEAIASGANHCLALDADGRLWAWGENSSGQLGNGDGTITESLWPVQVVTSPGGPAFEDIEAIASGAHHSLILANGILNYGTVWGWGDNSDGQLGNGDATHANKNVPVLVKGPAPDGKGFLDLSLTIYPQRYTGDRPYSVIFGFMHSDRIDNTTGKWTFGDGASSVGDPSHTYTEAGTYEVTLTVDASDTDAPGPSTQSTTGTVVVQDNSSGGGGGGGGGGCGVSQGASMGPEWLLLAGLAAALRVRRRKG